MLAIVAPRFGVVSETFIARHVRNLAPESTVLLSSSDCGTEQFGCPVLSDIEQDCNPRSLPERIGKSIRWRWRYHVNPGLGGPRKTRIVDFFKMHNVDVVLAEYGQTGLLVAPACAECNIPLFVHFHGMDANSLARIPAYARHFKSMFREITGAIVASSFLRRKLVEIGCPENKIFVCPFGIDIPAEVPSSDRIPGKIISVSRLTQQKGVIFSLKTVGEIVRRGYDIRYHVIGDGPEAENCRQYVLDTGLSENVHFAGALPNETVLKELQTAQIFVQHCVTPENGSTESFGISILEAMAAGLPVVSTRHGAIPESVVEGETGLLVDEKDISAMANAVIRLLDNPEEAQRMGVAGRQRVKASYSSSSSIDCLRSILGLPQEPS